MRSSKAKDGRTSVSSALQQAKMDGNGAYPERGARRRKFAGYLRAANEIRQTYAQQYGFGRQNDGTEDDEDSMPGAYPDVSVVRSGEEEMLLFPSYARRHHAKPAHPRSMPGANEDLRGDRGSGDAEYWKQEWDKYEDQNAVVDVDIRGWVYSPQRGQMTRKNRLLVGIARHLSGIPAPSKSRPNSRASSPHASLHGRVEAHNARHEDEMAAKEAESITRRGQGEADVAWGGGYSEAPSDGVDRLSIHSSPNQSRSGSPVGSEFSPSSIQRPVSTTSLGDDQSIKSGLSKRSSWSQPAQMTSEELAMANANLMMRLRPFLTTPLVQTPLTVFFYNEDTSKSRTVTTNEAGHFQLRALLDFLPTHVRVLASDKLSATEEVRITETKGVSMISDIDDTIKHSGIGAGAKEIFRNAFVRDLSDLTIDGVREWYTCMADLGVKLHYVSNAPWQLYPVLVDFFAKAGLPKGSFHLKQYTGMLQGIFEPVAERKKGTLERIMTDFPERQFVLVGDSGEADLELYTEILLSYPGRILGVFIRDVTTTKSRAFFDSITKSAAPRPRSPFRGRSRDTLNTLTRRRAADAVDIDSPAPPLPPRASARGIASTPVVNGTPEGPKLGTLIDFDDEPSSRPKSPPSLYELDELDSDQNTSTKSSKSPPPALPSKPPGLRSTSGDQPPASAGPSTATVVRKPAPPLPPKPRSHGMNAESNAPADPSPLSQIHTSSPPKSRSSSVERPSYRAAVRNKMASAYNSLPSFYGSYPSSSTDDKMSTAGPTSSPRNPPSSSTLSGRPPPPIPPRRNITSNTLASVTPSTNSAGKSNGAPPGNSITSESSSNGTLFGSGFGGAGSSNGAGADPILSKKEEMWLRRWARAKEVFDEKGVVLRSWRVGADVAAEAVKLVEGAMREMEEPSVGRERNRKGDQLQVRGRGMPRS